MVSRRSATVLLLAIIVAMLGTAHARGGGKRFEKIQARCSKEIRSVAGMYLADEEQQFNGKKPTVQTKPREYDVTDDTVGLFFEIFSPSSGHTYSCAYQGHPPFNFVVCNGFSGAGFDFLRKNIQIIFNKDCSVNEFKVVSFGDDYRSGVSVGTFLSAGVWTPMNK